MNPPAGESISKDEAHVFEALAAALKELKATVELADLGRFTKAEAAEIRAYQRDWKHPLGLVLDR